MYTANKALQVMTKDIHISLLNHDINTVCCKKPLLQYKIEIYNHNKSILSIIEIHTAAILLVFIISSNEILSNQYSKYMLLLTQKTTSMRIFIIMAKIHNIPQIMKLSS